MNLQFLGELARKNPEHTLELRNILKQLALGLDDKLNNSLLTKLVLKHAQMASEIRRLNLVLSINKQALEDDLAAAANIQQTLLPKSLPDLFPIDAAWEYVPCSTVGGDLVNIIPYDEDKHIFFVLDVAGHGPRAAMITVAVAQFLQPSTLNKAQLPFLQPAEMLKILGAEFPFQRFNSFFTIIYGMLSVSERKVRFANGGHPLPIYLPVGKPGKFLEEHGPLLGIGIDPNFPEVEVSLEDGHLLFYTDGLTESANHDGQLYGEELLLKLLDSVELVSAQDTLTRILTNLSEFSHSAPLRDDLTLLSLGWVKNATQTTGTA